MMTKHVHVVAITTSSVYETTGELAQYLRSLEDSHPELTNPILDKHNTLKLEGKMLSSELQVTSEGFTVSRIFSSLNESVLFDEWYKNNEASITSLCAATGWTFESTNIFPITDERWAEIEATLTN
jgi:hypothetical protein